MAQGDLPDVSRMGLGCGKIIKCPLALWRQAGAEQGQAIGSLAGRQGYIQHVQQGGVQVDEL